MAINQASIVNMSDSVKTKNKSVSKNVDVSKPFRRPYNRYNLFFILERERLIQMRGGYTSRMHSASFPKSYFRVELPPFPPRYNDFVIPDNWYFPVKKNGKRLHRKSH